MLYNKWIFDAEKGLGISLPVGLTGCHQVVLWLASSIYLRYRRRMKGPEPSEALTSEQIREHESNRSHQFWRYILPTAIFSAGDIGFGNMSLRYIPLTVHIIIKSSSIVFVLLFSCFFKIERFNWRLFGIVIVMATGVCMMVYKPIEKTPETDADADAGESKARATFFFGCMLVLLSSCLSGLRWVYTQLILRNKTHRDAHGNGTGTGNESDNDNDKDSNSESQNHAGFRKQNGSNLISQEDKDLELEQDLELELERGALLSPETPAPGTKKNNPIRTINSLSPIMAVTLFITSVLLEHPWEKLPTISEIRPGMLIAKIIGLMVLPGCCVLAFTWCEFSILRVTKVLTLSIAGIVKEVLTVILSMVVLHERLHGASNWIGMVIILADVVYYNFFRFKSSTDEDPEHSNTNTDNRRASQSDIPMYPMAKNQD